VTGLETFRQLKAIGDMEAALRNTTTILRTDLAADHFDGKRRLSDPQFWQPQPGAFPVVNNAVGMPVPVLTWPTQFGPPRWVFLALRTSPVVGVAAFLANTVPQSLPVGLDPDGARPRARAGPVLPFPVKTRGNRREDFFSAGIGNLTSPLLKQGFGQAD